MRLRIVRIEKFIGQYLKIRLIVFSSCILDLSQTRVEGPKQPHLKVFPRTLQGERRRSFNKEWYSLNKWLEYSQSKDSAYCYACRHFSLPSSGDSAFTSVDGFSNWKKAMYKDGGFASHAKSEPHVHAMLAWAEYEKATASHSSLSASLNAEYEKIVRENREYIKTIAETLLLTATQNIPQRGHNQTEGENKGNFLFIMELLAKHDNQVKRKMMGQRNATYLGHSTKNEIIDWQKWSAPQ